MDDAIKCSWRFWKWLCKNLIRFPASNELKIWPVSSMSKLTFSLVVVFLLRGIVFVFVFCKQSYHKTFDLHLWSLIAFQDSIRLQRLWGQQLVWYLLEIWSISSCMCSFQFYVVFTLTQFELRISSFFLQYSCFFELMILRYSFLSCSFFFF